MDRLDSDRLRTFLAVAETGSITQGAARALRSQSAVSLQIKQLEAVLGTAVFHRHGRGVVLTPAGRRLVEVARRVTLALDHALEAARGGALSGRLRLGLPDEYGRETLSRIIAAFARDHPQVDLTVQCGLSAAFPDLLARGALDLAVFDVASPTRDMEPLREEQVVWLTSPAHAPHLETPTPVALFDRACWWREAALADLTAWGRAYRIVYSSESTDGVAAAVQAGIAVGLLHQSAMRRGLTAAPGLCGVGPPRLSTLVLQRAAGADRALTDAMAAAIRSAFTADPA